MAMNYYSASVGNDMSIIISPLTNQQAVAAGIEIDQSGGYYLYCTSRSCPGDVDILAKVQSEDAAFTLSRLLSLS